jgi:hypothetical protein
MENPGSWTLAEHIIRRACLKHDEMVASGAVGGSLEMCIATALREAGLLKPHDPADALGFRAFEAEDILNYIPVAETPRPAPQPFTLNGESFHEESSSKLTN